MLFGVCLSALAYYSTLLGAACAGRTGWVHGGEGGGAYNREIWRVNQMEELPLIITGRNACISRPVIEWLLESSIEKVNCMMIIGLQPNDGGVKCPSKIPAKLNSISRTKNCQHIRLVNPAPSSSLPPPPNPHAMKPDEHLSPPNHMLNNPSIMTITSRSVCSIIRLLAAFALR
jgi:hypothetical protein